VSQLDMYCSLANEGGKKRQETKEEDNSFRWLTIRNVRIILIKIMDKAKHVNTFWVIYQEETAKGE